MGVADLPGQPAVFKPNKWPISPKYAFIFDIHILRRYNQRQK
jgi:hypothetical protein